MTTIRHGEEMRARMRSERFETINSEVVRPRMSGLDLFRPARAIHRDGPA